jgi:hypothetical protein
VLDDLHWADPSSLLLLRSRARAGTAALLVLGTYRDTDGPDHPLDETLTSLRREPVFERVALPGLSVEEVVALMEARAGHPLDDAGRALAAALQAETEGNPFFVVETLRHLRETGRLAQTDGRWRVTVASLAELDIPEGVRQVIGRRLGRLAPETNRVLQSAAVLGREVDVAVLRTMVGVEEDILVAALEEADAAQVLDEVRARGAPLYRFSHALIQQTLVEELSLLRRQRLHLRAAEAIERVHARGLDRHLTSLARHYREAGAAAEPATVVAITRRAAEAARAVYAWEEALGHYQTALDVLEDADPALRCDLLLAVAEVLNDSGQPERVLTRWRRRRGLAEAMVTMPAAPAPAASPSRRCTGSGGAGAGAAGGGALGGAGGPRRARERGGAVYADVLLGRCAVPGRAGTATGMGRGVRLLLRGLAAARHEDAPCSGTPPSMPILSEVARHIQRAALCETRRGAGEGSASITRPWRCTPPTTSRWPSASDRPAGAVGELLRRAERVMSPRRWP